MDFILMKECEVERACHGMEQPISSGTIYKQMLELVQACNSLSAGRDPTPHKHTQSVVAQL